jgi:hypothetical protein
MDNLESQNDDGQPSAFKQKLGQVGRSLKKVDLQSSINQHPLAAIGIAAAAGALIGIVRPKKDKTQRGRVQGMVITGLGMIAMRVVREFAMKQIGSYAKDYLDRRQHERQGAQGDIGSQQQGVEGGNVRYTPAL